LTSYDGLIVPGGFGSRGIEGKIKAIKFAREHGIPYLGLCYGMQLATIEFARNVAGITGAPSTELNSEARDRVIHFMPGQEKKVETKQYGSTMRLGAYPCVLQPGTKTYEAYGAEQISERHRHRYEFNNLYREKLEKLGFVIAGTSPDNSLVEVIEIKDHPFFVGVQFHPEFKSRPLTGHPLFNAFIKAAGEYSQSKKIW
jgi:CTP synthase